jgi:hypothetical protein
VKRHRFFLTDVRVAKKKAEERNLYIFPSPFFSVSLNSMEKIFPVPRIYFGLNGF